MIVKACLAQDGQVWVANGLDSPRESGQCAAAFADDLVGRGLPCVRVLGTRRNAALIEAICKQVNEATRVEVASPQACLSSDERNDPEIVLYRMRQWLVPPSLGGWHRVGPQDRVAYAMVAAVDESGQVTEQVLRLLQQHPAYYDLTFIPTMSPEAAALLLTDIVDPRWFVDIKNPCRLSRLRAYLGCSPAFAYTTERSGDRRRRYQTTVDAWAGTSKPSAEELQSPGNFLWRRCEAAGGGSRGLLRSSQAFLVYLVRTWQQQLFANSPQQLEMFIPESLLKGSEVAAYRQHATSRPQR